MSLMPPPPTQQRPMGQPQGSPQVQLPPMQPTQPPVTPSYDARNLLSPDEFQKLKEKVRNSYQRLEPHRNARLDAIKQYVAGSYGKGGDDPSHYDAITNILDQMVEVYMQQLVSGNPQSLILTQKLSLKTCARYFEMALNHVIHQIDLREALAYAILESLFSMAIVKVGVEAPEFSQRSYPFDVSAVPFAEAVFFDDWVHDTGVNRWELIGFCGDRYKELKDVVREDPRNDKKALESLDSATSNSAFDSQSPQTADNLAGAPEVYDIQSDFVRLWDIWLPRKRLLVTYLDNGGEHPLRVMRWDGPPRGPYRVGRYKLVLNNIMPKPPAMDVAPMADLHNRVWMKAGEQVSRQKTITFAPLAANRDAQTIIKASDGDVVNVQHGDMVRQAKYGGIEQENLVAAAAIKTEASEMGGNIQTMGGLSPQAGTLGQEELLSQASSGRIRSRQVVVTELVKGVMSDIAWYLWNDPLVRISVTDKIPNTDVEFEVNWPIRTDEFNQEIDMRQGTYNDYNFDIEPYSLQDQSPGTRAAKLQALVGQTILPAMQLLQAQGITLDWQEYLRKLSVYLGLPELTSILQFANLPPDAQDQPVNTGPQVKPPQTTRQYDRVVKPGGGDQTAQMIAALPASGSNASSSSVGKVAA